MLYRINNILTIFVFFFLLSESSESFETQKQLMELFLLFKDKNVLMDNREKYITQQKNNLLAAQTKFDGFMREISSKIKQDKKRYDKELDAIKQTKRTSNLFMKRAENMVKQNLKKVLIKPAEKLVINKKAIKSMQSVYESMEKTTHIAIYDPSFDLVVDSYDRKIYQPIIDNFNFQNILLMKNEECNICYTTMTIDTMALLECQHVKCLECILKIIKEKNKTTGRFETLGANKKEIMFLCSFCTMKNYTFSIVEPKDGKLVHAHYEKNPTTNDVELRHMYQDL